MENFKFVLVADDFDSAAELIARIVELATPHRGVAVKDGEEALQRAIEQKPDVCLLDLDMPRMGGIETARALRAMFRDGRPLLVGMTGGGAYFEAIQSGMFDDVLSKPLDMGRLLRVIERG